MASDGRSGRSGGWLGGDLETVVATMRRLGITELTERQRRIVLGPLPTEPIVLPASESDLSEPPTADLAETDWDPDRFAASGMQVPSDLRRALLERARR